MRKIWVIARREYLATVRTKAFLISVILMPVMMGMGIVISIISKSLEDQGEKRFAIVDRTPGQKVFPILEVAMERRNEKEIFNKQGSRTAPRFILERIEPSDADPDAVNRQRLELSQRVRKGEIAGVLEIGPKAMQESSTLAAIVNALKPPPKREEPIDPARDPEATRFQSKPTVPGAMDFYRWATFEIALATRMGLASQKPEVRRALLEQKVPVVMLGLTTRDPVTGDIVDDEGIGKSVAGVVVGIAGVLLMFMIVMVVATPMMQGVLEEKMQRISEVLLGSLTPFQLMSGKLLGGVGVALTLAALYLGSVTIAVVRYGYYDQIPSGVIPWFLFYQILALLMYGSMFMAIGAACTDMKEPQTLMLPVLLPAMLPMFLLGPIVNNPDGTIARAASFFPPSTPMLMIARQGMSANIQWWEPLLGAAIVLAFTTLCVWAAGRIFRVGILMQGKGARFGEMLRWVVRG
jgi:ABC-2 type transport system permease protein